MTCRFQSAHKDRQFPELHLQRLEKERFIGNLAWYSPYPLGQASGTPALLVGQYPVEYICANAPVATGIVAKEVPTTEINPVPIKYGVL